MSKTFLSPNPTGASVEDTSVTWVDSTLNESYLSATATSADNTQYYSVLETSTDGAEAHETTALVQLEEAAGELQLEQALGDEGAVLQMQSNEDVMLFRVEGSDEMYAFQVAEDENGKLQKYQFRVQMTSDGQYEAVQDSITVIPFDMAEPIITLAPPPPSDQLINQSDQVDTNSSEDIVCPRPLLQISVKSEPSQVQMQLEQLREERVIGNVKQEYVSGRERRDQEEEEGEVEVDYDYEEEGNAVVDSKEGILRCNESPVEGESANIATKMEYFHTDSNSLDNTDQIPDEEQDLDENNEHIIQGDVDHIHETLYEDNNQIHQQELEENDPSDQLESTEMMQPTNQTESIDQGNSVMADGIEYVGVEEPTFDGSIVDESTQLHEEPEGEEEHPGGANVQVQEEGEEEEQFLEAVGEEVVQEGSTASEPTQTYIIATSDGEGGVGGNGEVQYQQIYLSTEQVKSPSRGASSTIKHYIDASQLQQLTLAAAAGNNNQLQPNSAYIVTKIINSNQSITTTANSIDQGVKLVRSLKIKRISSPSPSMLSSPPPLRLTTSHSHSHSPPPITLLNNHLRSPLIIEKENHLSNTNVISNVLKPNPRSLLKTSHHVIVRKPDLCFEPVDKRFARSKELQQKRMFRDYIERTTILQAPIRQERLPRKQLIKPVQRTDEEIIVRQMVISSNGGGFIETADDKSSDTNAPSFNRSFDKQTDSDSDFRPYQSGKRKRKYRKRKLQGDQNAEDSDESALSDTLQDVIDLSADSEGEEIVETIIINSTGKRRGRPPKPKPDSILGKRRGRPPKSRPLDPPKSASEAEETIEILPVLLNSNSTEHRCSECPKVFPSVGGLRTHMNFHKYCQENTATSEKPEEESTSAETFTNANKYSCTKCNSFFKNAILLSKHMLLHNKKDKFECKVCRKVYSDNVQLQAHKRSHVKDSIFQATSQISPKKRASQVPVFKCLVCTNSYSNQVLLDAHRKTHKSCVSCRNCDKTFLSKVLLDNHVRLECVKNKSPAANKKITFVARKSNVKSVAQPKFAKPRLSLMPKKRTIMSSLTTKTEVSKRKLGSSESDYSSMESLASTSASVASTPGRRAELTGSARSLRSTEYLHLKLKCDQCEKIFPSHKLFFQHKVLLHGLDTPDKTIRAVAEAEEKEKRKRLYNPVGAHSGVPARKNIVRAFNSMKEKLAQI